MLYYDGEITQPEELAQKNMRKFMKILLVKRLESSYHAFRLSLGRFINSYQQFIREFEKGNIYVSKKYANKLFEMLENDDDVGIQQLVDEDKARRYHAQDFKSGFKTDLDNDLAVLLEIEKLWRTVKRDPKILTFADRLKNNHVLSKNKLIVFTESRETAEYLDRELSKLFPGKVLSFSGASGAPIRDAVIANFDARARHPKDDSPSWKTTQAYRHWLSLKKPSALR
jgi:ERCC4-related helicase